jgi:hypothetical protein
MEESYRISMSKKHNALFWSNENVLRQTALMVYNSMNILKSTDLYISNGWVISQFFLKKLNIRLQWYMV